MRRLTLEPLTADAFAPFGDVIEVSGEFGRHYFSDALGNARPAVPPSLSVTTKAPSALPLTLTAMERHEYSSQTFVPMDVSRWLVVVAPHGRDGGPDIDGMRGFLARGDQGVTFGVDVWHAPNAVLDRPSRMAIFMWAAGDDGDEEFRDLPEPVMLVTDD